MTLLAQYVALARDLIVIGLGIYATIIVKKQLELKQTEIETVKATAEHLKAMQAPAEYALPARLIAWYRPWPKIPYAFLVWLPQARGDAPCFGQLDARSIGRLLACR